eukprot:Pgem_evm1s11596
MLIKSRLRVVEWLELGSATTSNNCYYPSSYPTLDQQHPTTASNTHPTSIPSYPTAKLYKKTTRNNADNWLFQEIPTKGNPTRKELFMEAKT